MQTLWSLLTFAGGIGLFLLGMKLMTDGLRVAAGEVLRDILTAATASPVRGILSGVLITTVVQSSSAVIFATIGFVNAGLLSLLQAIGVIYGANVGTTLTSWIVAVVGFNVNLQALALPAIAAGMALRITGGTSRRGPLGEAIAGLGLFFLGIDVLRDSFAHLGDAALLERFFLGDGLAGTLLFILVGVVLTVLMQSSSAALAITLTAAAGGLIPFPAAAAMVIGANVGTTSTAVFAAIGATAPAQRAATAHVVFNVVTALAAIVLLPLLLPAVLWVTAWLSGPGQVAVSLAVFHTLTKLLGLALLFPLTPRLAQWLERRFLPAAGVEVHPHHLDRNVLTTPTLALDALLLELRRMGVLCSQLLGTAMSDSSATHTRLQKERDALESLGLQISDFTAQLGQQYGETDLDATLPDTLRVTQYLLDIADRSLEIHELGHRVKRDDSSLWAQVDQYRARVAHRAHDCLSARVEEELDASEQSALEEEYQTVKNALLRAGIRGELPPPKLVNVLDQMSALRRVVDQSTKTHAYLRKLATVSRTQSMQ